MKFLILTTGSVSAYLAVDLQQALYVNGHETKCYCTESAKHLITSHPKVKRGGPGVAFLTVEHEILDWRDKSNHPVLHIDLVNWADVCLVCPADFNIIGKMAHGIADDVVSSTLAAWLGSGKPLFVAPAMNTMMYSNPFFQKNRCDLMEAGVSFIEPTVKKLACGDYGIGGLADVGTIAKIICGHHWMQPIMTDELNSPDMFPVASSTDFSLKMRCEPFFEYLPKFDEPGAFGARRKFDRHEGVDIYCKPHASVFAVEDGTVVDSYQYTGKKADCGWWNDTWCVKVKGESGVVTYGELEMPKKCDFKYPKIGTKVKAGDFIGVVGAVLPPEKIRRDIRHHNNYMLHMELRRENCHLDGWKLNGDRDKRLLDPTPFLKDADIIVRG